MALTDQERFDRYVAWTRAIGAPTQMTFESWLRQDSEGPLPAIPTMTAEAFLASARPENRDDWDGGDYADEIQDKIDAEDNE